MSHHPVSALLFDLEKTVVYGFGYTLAGFNVAYFDIDVRLMIKVWDDRGKPLVAFIQCPTLLDCFEYLELAIKSNAAPLKFRPDKYGKLKEA